MVNICEEFATERNLRFGTNVDPSKSKTKCIVFSKKQKLNNPAPIKLNGENLPWVKKITHLGCVLECDNSMKLDIIQKRGQFIGKVNSLFQEFHYTSPEIMFKLVSTYACSFYGSQLWNLRSKEAEKLYNSWNVTVRHILNLDRKTHRCLIEPLSNRLHLKTILLSRLVSFYKGLINSKKFVVRFLARLSEYDHRTVLGKTLDYLQEECKLTGYELDGLTPTLVKKNLVYEAVSPDAAWKSCLALELFKTRNKKLISLGLQATRSMNFLSSYVLSKITIPHTLSCTIIEYEINHNNNNNNNCF